MELTLQFSEEQEQQFMRKLWELLKWQAEKYKGVDSTSMPVEKAQELLESLQYTIAVVRIEEGLSAEVLLKEELKEIIKRGQTILTKKRKLWYIEWNQLCARAPGINNVFYVDTMKNLGMFFRKYDVYYSAHQIPCSIDYPLMNPISEDIKGISYIEEYIRRVRIENQFINCFDYESVVQMLKNVKSNYREDYYNLCEPVLVSAVGRMILGLDIFSLKITDRDIELLNEFFDYKTKSEIMDDVREAISDICSVLDCGELDGEYFVREAESLAVRIDIAMKKNGVEGVFLQ